MTARRPRTDAHQITCFEVHRNGEKLCAAGLSRDGNMSVLMHISTQPRNAKVFVQEAKTRRLTSRTLTRALTRGHLAVGGLEVASDGSPEYLTWVNSRLKVGDEIRIRIIKRAKPDKPAKRRRDDPAKETEIMKRYVRAEAKKLGWKVIEQRKYRA